MKNISKLFFNIIGAEKSYLKKFSSIFSSSILVQLLPFIIIPIVTRKVDEFETGLYFTWLSLSISLTIVLGGKLDMAVLNSKTKEQAKKLIQLSFLFSILASLVLLLIYVGLGIFGVEFEKINSVKKSLGFLVINSVVTNIINCIFSYQIFSTKFDQFNISRIIQSVLINSLIFLVLISKTDLSSQDLIFFHTLGSLVSLLIIIVYSKILTVFFFKGARLYFKLLREFKDFPKFSMPGEVLNSFSNNIPFLFILSKYDPVYLGYYAIISKTLSAPIGIISNTFVSIFKNDSSIEIRATGTCKKSYYKLLSILLFVAIPLFIIISLLLPEIFIWLYGEKYRAAGKIAIFLVPLFFFRFIASPLSYTFFITNNQKPDLYWQMALFISVLACFSLTQQFDKAILTFSLAYSLLYFINLLLSYNYSKKVK